MRSDRRCHMSLPLTLIGGWRGYTGLQKGRDTVLHQWNQQIPDSPCSPAHPNCGSCSQEHLPHLVMEW